MWDPEVKLKGRIAETAPTTRRPTETDTAVIASLIERHIEHTASPTAQTLFNRLSETLESFWVIAASGKEPVPLSEETSPASAWVV